MHGNLMHCTARGNIAYNFLRLKEDAIYFVKNFTVQPNKDDFCVLRFAHFIVETDGDTIVRKSAVKPDGFARSLSRICNTLHFSDNVSYSYTIDICCWIGCISSTSSTMIVDDEQIPVLKQFKSDDSGIEIAKELLPADSTCAKLELLKTCLCGHASTFHCSLRVDKIRTKRGWNYPSFEGKKCKKGNLDRKDDSFWLELEVLDDTAQTVVVMFDETTRAVVKCLMGSIDEEEMSLPPALANIMGKFHTLELKSNSYNEHVNYKSFTCWMVVLEEALDKSGSSGTLAGIGEPKAGVLERHDSDGEESFVADSKTKGVIWTAHLEWGNGKGW
nr:hypothetical protein [Tanacetum cinerariifolium]